MAKKLTTRTLRQNLRRMGDEEILMMARGAVDELTARNVIGCSIAIKIINMLGPENVRPRT